MNRTTTTRIAFAVLAVAFFTAPIAARMLGITAETFENRKFAEAPKLSQRWNAFQQTTAYLTDRMPLRAQAVRANTRIWQDVFDTTPRYGSQNTTAGDQALPFAGSIERDDRQLDVEEDGGLSGPATASAGRDGWLYLEEEFEYACSKPVPDDMTLRRWGDLMRAIRAEGPRSMMFVAPHKASVYPEHLPEKYPFDHCALEQKERFWRLLSHEGPALGVHELRSELVRLKAHAGDELFELTDTHWTTLGAMTLVRAVLDAVGDGIRLEPSEIVERGMVPYIGDLSIVGGRSDAPTHMEYGIERAPDAPRVPGRTLLICDSFGYKWLRLFRPYFEHFRFVSLYHSDEIVDAIRSSDTVILEANEIFLRAQAADGRVAVSAAKALGG